MQALQRLLVLSIMLTVAGLPAVACGGSRDEFKPPELSQIPTATLPNPLPEPLIVGQVTMPVPGTSYTVQSGDSPSSIAERFGITADAIMEANGITDPTGLVVGQVLTIPGASRGHEDVLGATAVPTERIQVVEPTATFEPAPATAEPTEALEPTVAPATPGDGQVYIVQEGDIPETIAAQFGITAEELMAANGITDPTSLQIGQELIIPSPAPEP